MPEVNSITRHCKRCNQTKPIADFYQGKKVGYTCIPCHNASTRANYRRNLTRRKAQLRAYNKAHVSQLRETARRFKETQPDRHKRNMHAWYVQNKERHRQARTERRIAAPRIWQEATRRWRQGNREKTRAYRKNRAARERGAEGNFSASDIKCLYHQQDGKCAACRISISDGFHIDHIIPIVRGGSNWPYNLQLLCPLCNRQKGALLPEEWDRKLAAVK